MQMTTYNIHSHHQMTYHYAAFIHWSTDSNPNNHSVKSILTRTHSSRSMRSNSWQFYTNHHNVFNTQQQQQTDGLMYYITLPIPQKHSANLSLQFKSWISWQKAVNYCINWLTFVKAWNPLWVNWEQFATSRVLAHTVQYKHTVPCMVCIPVQFH